MKNFKFKCLLIYIFSLWMILLSGCQSGYRSFSSRAVLMNDKPGKDAGHLPGTRHAKESDVFIKESVTTIEPRDNANSHGSLFQIDDQRNYLFAQKTTPGVGDFVYIKVLGSSTQKEAEEKTEEKPVDLSANIADAELKAMMDALPELDPGEEGRNVPAYIAMQVSHIYSNGDLGLLYRRESEKQLDYRVLRIKSRLPYLAWLNKNQPTTQDLVDISWKGNTDGEMIERYAASWQDEYTLRLAGFTEAKSSYARQLEEKRKKLAENKSELTKKILSLSRQRDTYSKERQGYIDRQKADAVKLAELEAELKEFREAEKAKEEEAAQQQQQAAEETAAEENQGN